MLVIELIQTLNSQKVMQTDDKKLACLS